MTKAVAQPMDFGKCAQRGRRSFRPGDVTCAIKAATKAGQKVHGVEIAPDGRIIMTFGPDDDIASRRAGDWDDVT